MARKLSEVGPCELLFIVENEFFFPEGLSEADRWFDDDLTESACPVSLKY